MDKCNYLHLFSFYIHLWWLFLVICAILDDLCYFIHFGYLCCFLNGFDRFLHYSYGFDDGVWYGDYDLVEEVWQKREAKKFN